ncbi:sarcosine oxidase subunit delta [uncultured Pelagimonas sp.]|uniref:sarcosine oxidase subunit delta n=1 Tax=uncultured Pelagimonas sp. TaxID=1618102 RepID=UPI0026070866|nr:sarcosine oxidase subunit delta [uncultured Pelagimonas sp.]
MRLTCPNCGDRDSREFTYQGAASMLDRPAPDAGAAIWHAYLHLRDNPAGHVEDLWYHGGGCGAWLIVTRDTITHDVQAVQLAGARNAG